MYDGITDMLRSVCVVYAVVVCIERGRNVIFLKVRVRIKNHDFSGFGFLYFVLSFKKLQRNSKGFLND